MAGGLDSLEPTFKPIVEEILAKLKAKGWQPIVAEGRRTLAEQKEKVRLGYSTTLNSYHLSGMAADVVDKRFLWNINISHQFWKDLGRIVIDMIPNHPGLRWGGDWGKGWQRYQQYVGGKTKYFIDVAHVEMRV
jgi:hypothetical protein